MNNRQQKWNKWTTSNNAQISKATNNLDNRKKQIVEQQTTDNNECTDPGTTGSRHSSERGQQDNSNSEQQATDNSLWSRHGRQWNNKTGNEGTNRQQINNGLFEQQNNRQRN
jgi:hypothetical protein